MANCPQFAKRTRQGEDPLQYLFWYIKQRRRLQGSQPSSCRMAGFRLLLVLLHSAYRL